MKTIRAYLFAAAAAAVALPSAAAAAQAPIHIRGTIVSSTPASLTVKTASGLTTVTVGSKVSVAGAMPGTIADITPGKFLGIASAPGTGPNKALEVAVFAESMRGAGEGDYPWDSASTSMHHSSMTNGTVSIPMSHSTMTNANASSVSGSTQKTITMNYKGGSRTLVVPPGTPVVRIAPATKALFIPGSSVFVVATPGSKPAALFAVVGENGTKLPM